MEKRQFMLLQETNVVEEKLEEILSKMKLRYEGMATYAKGSAGGIAILWNPTEVTVDYWIGMQRILTGRFCLIGSKDSFLLLIVYGPHILIENENFLQKMKTLNQMHDEKLWLIAGDFHLITSLEEKKGGFRREEPEMEKLKDIQEELHLVDIPKINARYTWKNRRRGNRKITSRLDRFLETENIISKYVYYEASILPFLGSDHWLIRL